MKELRYITIGHLEMYGNIQIKIKYKNGRHYKNYLIDYLAHHKIRKKFLNNKYVERFGLACWYYIVTKNTTRQRKMPLWTFSQKRLSRFSYQVSRKLEIKILYETKNHQTKL